MYTNLSHSEKDERQLPIINATNLGIFYIYVYKTKLYKLKGFSIGNNFENVEWIWNSNENLFSIIILKWDYFYVMKFYHNSSMT